MSEPSPLSLRALAIGQAAVAAGVRGGVSPFARFRGLQVDEYQRSVGLPLAPNPTVQGFPWCSAAQYFNHAEAGTATEQSHYPRTASALHVAEQAPDYCKLAGPQPGAVGVLKHKDGIHGHIVQCETVNDDGTVTTCEGDTDENMSGTGDRWCRHTWNPADGTRGELILWADFGLQPPALVSA